uniref:Zona pellucida sperm-binding protein 3 n=2 Tax=Cynoglossus semilaevis TaxID=244447 RepID=A0A3P8W4Y1_CYNSE
MTNQYLLTLCQVMVVLSLCCVVSLSGRTQHTVGLELKCEEDGMKITVMRRFMEKMKIPFNPKYLRLGAKSSQETQCGPRGRGFDYSMIISVGLGECGTESTFRGQWLVYSNHLLLFPTVALTSSGSVIIRGATVVIPVECHFLREQTVSAEPLSPTWLPMTSTISVFGLLDFSIHTMEDDCTALRSSSVYQQGEAVFLEARVEAPLHPPLTVYVDYCVAILKLDPLSGPSYRFINSYGCLMDSMLPGSTSKFLPRQQDNKLCFSFHASLFEQKSAGQMFISCHLRATPKEKSQSSINKACFFHRPTFSWHDLDGNDSLCECCDSGDCGYSVQVTRPHSGTEHEGDATVGPLHTLGVY